MIRLIFFLFSAVSVFPIYSSSYYVSNTGSDTNDGLSVSTSFATIQHAAETVTPGDSVIVAAGEYVGFDHSTSGTSSAPIVFITFENAVINTVNERTPDGINLEGSSWIEIRGFEVTGVERAGIRAVLADHCIIRENYCHHNGRWGIFTGFTDDILIEDNVCSYSSVEHGIYVSNSSDRSIIRRNTCHHNAASGIQINADATLSGDGISSDPMIVKNILYENGTSGGAAINLDGAQNAFIANNLIYNNHATGIALFQIDAAAPSIDANIFNNTIVNASEGRWCILVVDGSVGASIVNNIMINRHSFRGSIAIDQNSLPGFASDYNITTPVFSTDGGNSTIGLNSWRSNTGQEFNSAEAEPEAEIFAGPMDFHLQDNSQPVDFGTDLSAQGIVDDIEGTTRPIADDFDAGAYEHPQGSLPITLLDFHTQLLEGNHILLKWATAQEIDFDRFIIEHSAPQKEFHLLHEVEGKGNGKESLNYYSWIHPHPAAGWNIYRLKMVDFDGSFEYSPLATQYIEMGNIVLYPNPSSDHIHITGVPIGLGYSLITVGGNETARGKLGVGPLSLEGISAGTYLLHLEGYGSKAIIKK